MKKILYCDIDGTLIYKDECDDCVQIEGEDRFFSSRTSNVLDALIEEGWLVVLITGRRKSGFDRISGIIPHNLAFIEHGTISIAEKESEDLVKNEDKLAVEKYKNELLQLGYGVDDLGRNLTFRIVSFQGKPLSSDRVEKIVTEQKSVDFLINEGKVDVVPVNAGKRQAMIWTRKNFGSDQIVEYAVGNDHNDMQMLTDARFSACPLSSEVVVIDLVKNKKDGFVATKDSHQGIVEILSKFKGESYES